MICPRVCRHQIEISFRVKGRRKKRRGGKIKKIKKKVFFPFLSVARKSSGDKLERYKKWM